MYVSQSTIVTFKVERSGGNPNYMRPTLTWSRGGGGMEFYGRSKLIINRSYQRKTEENYKPLGSQTKSSH